MASKNKSMCRAVKVRPLRKGRLWRQPNFYCPVWKTTLLAALLLGILGVVPVWVEGDIFDNPPDFNQTLQLPGSNFTNPLDKAFQAPTTPPLGETPEQRFIRENQPSSQTPQQQLLQGTRQAPSGGTQQPSGQSVSIQNPIGAQTFYELVVNIAQAVTGIALVLATLAIIIVGFKFVMASVSGDASKLTEAKKLLVWVLVGTAIVVGAAQLAGGIVAFVQGL